jgi:hypothetical protein
VKKESVGAREVTDAGTHVVLAYFEGQIDVFATAGLSREAWNLVQLLGK